jgi:hypothetical protein
MEGPEGEQRYSCTLSVISGLDGVGGKCHTLATVLPGKRPGTNHNTTNISMKKLPNCDVTSSSKELMQLFGDLDILSFVRISQLNWIGHVNRIASTNKVIEVFNNNPQGR